MLIYGARLYEPPEPIPVSNELHPWYAIFAPTPIEVIRKRFMFNHYYRHALSPPRKYEYEYHFANKLGGFVGRKMKQQKTRIVKLRIKPDNHYLDWFNGYCFVKRTAYKCFYNEFFNGWLDTQGYRADLKYKFVNHHIKTIVMGDRIVFIDIHGLRPDEARSVIDLEMNIKKLENIMEKVK